MAQALDVRPLGERVAAWADGEPSVELCVLIGSRARGAESVAAADGGSDWDFQVGTSNPGLFQSDAWLAALGVKPLAYALRAGRLGSALKASAVTDLGELDLVVIPVQPLRGLVRLWEAGGPVLEPQARQALTDLSAVIAGGYRLLKGAEEFAGFYARVLREVPPARLHDAEVRQLAEAFVCDYVFTRRRIERGEWVAAQRWLHHQLAEVNFRLLHELRVRKGLASFPDARRLELLEEHRAVEVRVAAHPDADSLYRAVEKAAATHRRLVAALVGDTWRWPNLASLGLRGE